MITVVVEQLPDSEAAGDPGSAVVALEGDAYRHLCRARRAEVGDRVRLTDGRGRACWSEVESIDRARARLICSEAAPTGEPRRAVELWVGTLRSSRASWLVEKATELGVRAIRFFGSEHAARSYGAAGLARLERVTVAAVEQCHRAWRPSVTGVHDWAELLDLPLGVYLDPGGARPGRVASLTASGAPLVICVGPEGGWSDAERRQLTSAGHRAVGLGARTLRVETAALAGLSLALAEADEPRGARLERREGTAANPGNEETS